MNNLKDIMKEHKVVCPNCGEPIDNTINHYAIEAAIAYALAENMKGEVSKIVDSVLQNSNSESKEVQK